VVSDKGSIEHRIMTVILYYIRTPGAGAVRLATDVKHLKENGVMLPPVTRRRRLSDLPECIGVLRAVHEGDAYLFWEQFVVKGTDRKGAEFGWHQDSGYVDHPHKPYVNCWIPLDDVSEQNGTIHILPYSRAGTRDKVEHRPVPGSNDRVGYFGDDPGEIMACPAGSIVVFSSTAFHRSGANHTSRMRRAYAVQYSPEIIYEPDGSLAARRVAGFDFTADLPMRGAPR
jgi:ectoine hydroxylase-related dioxygenase (phytanoyl-CoA dioxygenase family)